MKSPLISYMALFLGVFALSTSAIFVKLAEAPATITAFYRMLFAAAMLLPFLLLNRKNMQEIRLLSKKQWGLGLLSGVFLWLVNTKSDNIYKVPNRYSIGVR